MALAAKCFEATILFFVYFLFVVDPIGCGANLLNPGFVVWFVASFLI